MRDFTLDDFDDLYALNRDPRVMKYIADGKPSTRDEVAARAAAVSSATRRCIRTSASGTRRGATPARSSAGSRSSTPGKSTDIEIGYRLLRNAWGQGFATEGATALAHYGFDDLGLDRIIGVTHPGNQASQRVLMKAGLADVGWGRYYDRRLRLFAAERDGA